LEIYNGIKERTMAAVTIVTPKITIRAAIPAQVVFLDKMKIIIHFTKKDE
jgi:hypothetical protein